MEYYLVESPIGSGLFDVPVPPPSFAATILVENPIGSGLFDFPVPPTPFTMTTTQGVVELVKSVLPNPVGTSPGWIVRPGPVLPDMPDRLVLVTRVGGSPRTMEGVLARPGYQLRIRGTSDNPEMCERFADELVERLLDVSTQTMVGGVPLVEINIVGTLSPLPGTPDTGGRTEYVVTFILTVAANRYTTQ